MAMKSSSQRFSTVAEFDLIVGGATYSVAQIAADFLILRKPAALPRGPATLIIRVEGEEDRHEIEILDVEPDSTWVTIARG